MLLKKPVLLLCLFIYLLTVIKPLIPVIEYKVNFDYIVKKLCVQRDKAKNCCQGKCHLKNQLNKNHDNEQDKQIPYTHLNKNDISEYLFNTSENMVDLFYPLYYINQQDHLQQQIDLYEEIFHPPEKYIAVC